MPDSSAGINNCQTRKLERLYNLFGDFVDEGKSIIYVTPLLRDFNVFLPLSDAGESTRYRLSRILTKYSKENIVFCVAELDSVTEVVSKSSDTPQLIEIADPERRLLVTENIVFIENGTLTPSGVAPCDECNLCRHQYGSAAMFLKEELNIAVDSD